MSDFQLNFKRYMHDFESDLRRLIVKRIVNDYPFVTGRDYTKFLNGEYKPEINSWLGDAFTFVARELKLNMFEIDFYRGVLFTDDH